MCIRDSGHVVDVLPHVEMGISLKVQSFVAHPPQKILVVVAAGRVDMVDVRFAAVPGLSLIHISQIIERSRAWFWQMEQTGSSERFWQTEQRLMLPLESSSASAKARANSGGWLST